MTEELQETTTAEVVTPSEVTTQEPVVEAAPELPLGDVAPETETLKTSDKKSKIRGDDPLINTITGLRQKTRDQDAEIARLRQEAQSARDLAESLARGEQQRSAHSDQSRTATPDDAEVDRRAEYKLFLRDVNAVRSEGIREYGQEKFAETARLLESYGAADDMFLKQVMSVDHARAHQLLHDLARDPHLTISLVNMDPIKRVAELTRMSISRNQDGTFAAKTPDTPAAPAPAKQISKAPAPAPALQPTAHKTVDWRSPESDKMPDDEWFKAWENDERRKARSARL